MNCSLDIPNSSLRIIWTPKAYLKHLPSEVFGCQGIIISRRFLWVHKFETSSHDMEVYKVGPLPVMIITAVHLRSYFTPGKFHLQSATSRREHKPIHSWAPAPPCTSEMLQEFRIVGAIKRITWVSYTTHWLPLINRTWKTIGLQAFKAKNQRESYRFEQTPGAS